MGKQLRFFTKRQHFLQKFAKTATACLFEVSIYLEFQFARVSAFYRFISPLAEGREGL
jgi:hypothetical protein